MSAKLLNSQTTHQYKFEQKNRLLGGQRKTSERLYDFRLLVG